MSVKFVLNETSYFGDRTPEKILQRRLKKEDFKKVFLVSDKSLVRSWSNS